MGAVSPGDSNQKIMGSFRFGIALLVLISVVTAKDVFRYDDEKTGQSHYMTGDPGASVEGGWAFTNPDGTFELVYKADEGGFQPSAEHIPVSVKDTNDVTEAKSSFYTLFKEHEAKVAEAEASRAKRSPQDVFRYEDAETGQSHYMTGEPGKAVEGGWTFTNPEGSYELVYKADAMGFQPEAAHIPIPVEDTNEVEDAKAKFYSLYDEHKAKVEAAIAKDAAAVVDARRKRSPNDVFRYEDEETGQSHYMTGEPGKAVEGGWKFTNGDGTFELVYKADEAGFQPEADHIPVHGEDTVEVEEAKTQFYNLYEEAEARVADAIAAAEKEPTIEDSGAAKVVEISKREAEPHGWGGPAPYWHMPYLLHQKKEDLEGKAFKFEYYKGFVPEKRLEAEAEAKAKHEEAIAKYKADTKARHEEAVAFYKARQEEAKAKHDEAVALYKARHEAAVAKHKEAVAAYKEKMENTVYTFSPYYGYLPTTGEEVAEGVPTFKFVPYKGFVPQDKEAKTMSKREAEPHGWGPPAPYWHPKPYFLHHTKEDLEGKTFKFHPIKGFEPLDEDEETAGSVFKHVPYRGFVPEKQLELEAEAKAKHEEAVEKYQAEAKARHEESVAMYKKAREEAKAKHEAAVAKYEAEAKARYEKVVAYRKEAMAKHKEAVAKYKEKIENTVYTFSPYYGYIPTTGEESDEVPTFKYVPFHGFVPSEMDDSRRKRDTSDEMMEEDNLMVESNPKLTLLSPFGYMHNVVQPKEISYEFHPYYGYIPKLKTSPEELEVDPAAEVTEGKLYKYIPFYGFVPAEEEMEKTEEEEPVLCKYHPFHGFVPAKDQEDTEEPLMKTIDQLEYKYVPYVGFVPATEDDTAEEKEGTEETTEKRYKFHPYYGFVEKTTEGEEEPKEEQMYKFVPYYGFVPVNKDGESEMEQKSEDEDDQQHQFTYSFHPYYGYLPTLVKKGEADVAEEQFYKLDPV